MFKKTNFNNWIIIIILSANLVYKLMSSNYDYSSPIIGFTFSFLVARKIYVLKSFKKTYNVDIMHVKIKSFWHMAEIILTLEIYLCTPQFEKGMLNGITTNLGTNLIFYTIPSLLMYRFIIYRSLELK